jgi:hypothetical protein
MTTTQKGTDIMNRTDQLIRAARDAEDSVITIYLDWATRSAIKAEETTDPYARMFHRRNAEKDYQTAITSLEFVNSKR